MKKLIVLIPDDCTEKDAVLYVAGCFTPCQHDYQRYYNGERLRFGDNREGVFYHITDNEYTLEIQPKGV